MEQNHRYRFALAFVAFCAAACVRATSVTPPDFPALVGEAESVARATVTAVEARWVESPRGPVIKTFVTLAIDESLKGNPGRTITLQLLGGTIGAESLTVGGMPQFKVGDSEFVFVRGNGVQFCPLVRMMHGRYRIQTDPDTQRLYVARDDGIPLASVEDVQLPAENGALLKAFRTPANALSPDAFTAEIARELARQRPTQEKVR